MEVQVVLTSQHTSQTSAGPDLPETLSRRCKLVEVQWVKMRDESSASGGCSRLKDRDRAGE